VGRAPGVGSVRTVEELLGIGLYAIMCVKQARRVPKDLLKAHLRREGSGVLQGQDIDPPNDGDLDSGTIYAGGHHDKQPLMLCARHRNLAARGAKGQAQTQVSRVGRWSRLLTHWINQTCTASTGSTSTQWTSSTRLHCSLAPCLMCGRPRRRTGASLQQRGPGLRQTPSWPTTNTTQQ